MGLSGRQFTKEFKLAAMQRLERGASVAEVARAFEVNPNVLHRWRGEFRQGPGNAFPGLGKRRWEEGRIAQLERKIGQQTLEIDFLKGCLQRIDEQRKKKFVVTTDSDHGLPVHPNLARTMTVTGLDQLWVADITYIRLELEFVYLAVILDAFSRREIGWALDRTLEAELTLQALRMPLLRRRPAPGLLHHSDRGVQYASRDYTQLLQDHGIRISMSRKGNLWDNAACESFIKTLKYEEVYRTEYRDLADARASIGAFLEKVYNQKRLHSALGYLPPAEFERGLLVQNNKEAAARQLSL